MSKNSLRYILFVAIIFSCAQLIAQTANNTHNKLLVLIVDSDNDPIYAKLRYIWSLYMHSDPEHVEAYFIRGNPDIPAPYLIEGNTIFLQIENSRVPGIVMKTVMALEALSPRIGTEFNFVLRTNLSSFYIFDRLLKYLKRLPKTACYSGSILGPYSTSGCGFIISPDVAQIMMDNKEFLRNSHLADDDAIGELMHAKKIPAIFHPCKDYHVLERDWTPNDFIPPFLFQVRVKNDVYKLRHTDDMIIYKWLLEKFYHINLSLTDEFYLESRSTTG
jgi:hypothetical protein